MLRATHVLTFVVAAGGLIALLPGRCRAQNVGDTVVVIQTVRVKVGDKLLQKHEPGIPLIVSAINGDWLWINHKHSGWIPKSAVVSLDRAIEHFTHAIQVNPNDADAYSARGATFNALEAWEAATRDFGQAIRLNPKHTAAYGNRAIAWRNLGDYQKAIGDYNSAIELNPNNPMLYRNRAIAWRHQHQVDKALADLNEAIRLNPKQPGAYNSRAWIRATSPNAKYRDGMLAIEDAKRACDLSAYKSAEYLGTLAAAYAEAGEFDNAVHWQERAHEIAPAAAKAESENLLASYRARKPHRDQGENAELAASGESPR